MRIATGGISHETSTFAVTPTTLDDFAHGLGLFRGPAIVERFRGTNNCTGGFIAGADQHGFQLVPLLWTFVEMLLLAQVSALGRLGLAVTVILFFFSFGENLEILAYLFWPGLVVLGAGFAEAERLGRPALAQQRDAAAQG